MKSRGYTPEPQDKKGFTRRFDRMYSRTARIYDRVIKLLPYWRNWISEVLPHIQGPRVLEVSFGTGYLMTCYADRYETFGIDYNREMALIASQNLKSAGVRASIQQADVVSLPYPGGIFNTVISTMAFSGYPDARAALGEIRRVLVEDGRLVMVDVNYPFLQNYYGVNMARIWVSAGDILRDMGVLFSEFGFEYTDREVGGFGSVHLYVAEKSEPALKIHPG